MFYQSNKHTDKLAFLSMIALVVQCCAVGQSPLTAILIGTSDILAGIVILAVVYHLRRAILCFPQDRLLQLKDPLDINDVQALINITMEYQDKAFDNIKGLTFVFILTGIAYVGLSFSME